MTTPVPAWWPGRRSRVAVRVLVALLLAFGGWVSCAGTEVWTRVEPVDDAGMAGIWDGPDQARLVLGSDGEFHASHLPATAFRGGRVPQLDGVDARWTREPFDLAPDAIRVRFADPLGTELLFDIRRSWRGQPILVLWTTRCMSCRQVPVTFVRRS